ncbi:MAG: PP2C family protein-serine/threonine phosphatase, partial [Blastocatellia bacterium]
TNQHSEIEALRRRFVERFKDAVTSVAGCVDLAAGFVSPFSSDSIAKSRTCHCLQATALAPLSTSPCRRGRRRFEKDVRCGKVVLGRVWACYDGADRSLAAVIDYMVDAASKLVNLEEEEEALLEELSSCWENLEAVYEISSDTGSIQNPRELLDRIVGRALSLSTGLAGVLWIEEGAALQPIVTKNAMEMEPRDPSRGLIGKALSCFCASIINGRDEIVAAEGPNPELERAVSAAVIPLMTRHGFLGVLELWNEEEGSRFHSRDVKLLQTLAHQAGTVVENERLHRASIDTMRLRHEVEIGSNIQQALLVARTPRGLSNLKVAAISIPSQSIDGDFYDFIKHRDYCVDVLVGDVMGKGIPAALVGAATKTSFLRAMGQWSGALERHGIPSPEEIVTLVHRDMTRQLIGLESFATACYARFNTYLETVEIVDCGHPRTIRYSKRSDACETLAGDNMPLGFSEREIYKQFSVPLDKGDVFLFYSDGLTEAKSPDGEFFGEERVAESLKKYANLAAHQIVRRIQNEVSVFAASDILADDLTCV